MAFELGQRTPMGEEIEDERKERVYCDPLEDDSKYKYSPCPLLRRVLREELTAKDLFRNHKNNKLLVAAVHAVLLDSGFVRFSSATSVHDALLELGFAEFGSISGTSHSYTLPQILVQQDNNNSDLKMVQGIVLKFEYLGNIVRDQKKRSKFAAPRMVKISGSLINSGKEVCLEVDEKKFAPAFEIYWGNNIVNTTLKDLIFCETQVCEFWRIVKDEIALPLMIDLCTEASLPSPLCFMSLPLEIKLKILEATPGVDVAKVGIVCKELRDFSSDNELWKRKLAHEFAAVEFSAGTIQMGEPNWKDSFRRLWETKMEQRRKRLMRIRKKRTWENLM